MPQLKLNKPRPVTTNEQLVTSIHEMFNQLPGLKQQEVLKDLSASSKATRSIAAFAELHQGRFGKNIEFTVSKSGLDHAPLITVTCITAIGEFKGTGSNQKIAKAAAVAMAWNALTQ